MNSIRMEFIQTIYEYKEHYWMIDGEPVVQHYNKSHA